MAGPNLTGTSLGFGIGLQAKPDTQGYNFAAQGIQQANLERQRKEAAKAKKEEDAEEEWRKYAANIKVSGDIDPMYQNKVKELTGKHIALMAEQQRLAPYEHAYNNENLLRDKANLDTDLRVINNNTASLKQFDTIRPQYEASGAYNVNRDILKKIDEARIKGDPSILEGIKDEEGNPVVSGNAINPSTLMAATYTPNYDYQDKFLRSSVKPILVKRGSQVAGNEYIQTQDDEYVDVTASKNNIRALFEDPSYQIGQGYLKRAKGDMDKAVDIAFNAYAFKGKDVSKQGLKTKYQPNVASDKSIEDAFATTQDFKKSDAQGSQSTYTAYNYAVTPIPTNNTIPDGAYDPIKGKQVEKVGDYDNVKIGAVQVVSRIQDNVGDYKKGDVLNKDDIEFLKKTGNGGIIKSTVESEVTLDLKTPARGERPESTANETHLWPINSTRQRLEEKGYGKAVIAAEEKAAKENQEFRKMGVNKPAAKVAPKKETTATKKSSTPKIGDIIGGYKYKGGDTKDPKNWIKQ